MVKSTSRWRQAGSTLFLLLLVAEHLDVFFHQRSICSAENVNFFEVLLLHVQESFSIEVIFGHEINIAKIVTIFSSLTRFDSKFGQSSLSLDSKGKAFE